MKKLISKYYRIVAFLIAAAGIIPLLVISIYSRPSADDYSYSRYVIGLIRSGEANIFNLIKTAVAVDVLEWKTYDGPYISQIIMTLQPGIYGEKYYCIGAIALIILIMLCLVGAFMNLRSIFKLKEHIKAGEVVCLAMVTLAMILAGMPGISEGIYWFDGAWNYQPFFFLAIFNVTLILSCLTIENRLNKASWIVLTSVIAFIASGGNYIVTYANVMAMFTIAIYAITKKKYAYILPFIVSLAGFCLEFFAPGRMVRTESDMSGTSGIVATIVGTVKSVYAYFCVWINVQLVMWLILAVAVTILFISRTNFSLKLKLNPVWLFLYTIAFVAALFLLPCYAVGTDIVGRILNIIWFVFVLLCGVDVTYLLLWLNYEKGLDFRLKNENIMIVIMLGALLFICFFNNSNTIIALRELRNGTAQAFAEDNDVRYEAMKNASEGDELECRPLTRSYILFFDDLDENPEGWQNVAWKRYYGVGMHVVKE